MKNRDGGTFTVEFAIVAAALFIVLFAVIEVAHILWIWNTATEATRRGARVAAVCPINHPAVAEIAVFGPPGGGTDSPILQDVSTGNVAVAYLDEDGTAETVFEEIRYVRVSLNNYTFTPLIPFVNVDITLPPFETTIPSESLGYIPNVDDPTADPVCSCYGSPGPTTNCVL
jgi:hypothetical protein